MPKLKMSAREHANAKLMQAIKGSSAYYDISPEDQAQIAGVSRATWYRRLQNPGDVTLDEFRRLCRRFHWDEKTVLEIIRV